MSTGIQDAANLGWKPAAVANGTAPDSLLDTYHAERHPLGEQLMRNTHAATMFYLSGPEMDPLRALVRELVTDGSAAGHFAGMVSGLGVRYDMGPGTAGPLGLRLNPDRELERADGTRVRVAELLRPARGVLIGADGSAAAPEPAAAWADRVDTFTGSWPRSPPRTVPC